MAFMLCTACGSDIKSGTYNVTYGEARYWAESEVTSEDCAPEFGLVNLSSLFQIDTDLPMISEVDSSNDPMFELSFSDVYTDVDGNGYNDSYCEWGEHPLTTVDTGGIVCYREFSYVLKIDTEDGEQEFNMRLDSHVGVEPGEMKNTLSGSIGYIMYHEYSDDSESELLSSFFNPSCHLDYDLQLELVD